MLLRRGYTTYVSRAAALPIDDVRISHQAENEKGSSERLVDRIAKELLACSVQVRLGTVRLRMRAFNVCKYDSLDMLVPSRFASSSAVQ